jgi:hypothetical protein
MNPAHLELRADEHGAELTDVETQLIAAALLMWARMIPNGTAQDIARKFLHHPVQLTSYDRDVIVAALDAVSYAMQTDRVLPASQRYKVQEDCLKVAKKLHRSAH